MKFDEVSEKLAHVPYMTANRAAKMRELVIETDASSILELGFYQGKSTCYLAAMLEDRGKGHITTIDLDSAKKLSPNIHENLAALGIEHRVTTVYAKRSYTWELARMIKRGDRFDLCYLDGGHTWDNTGFGFVLVDLILRPGGIIVLDDMSWSIAKSIAATDAFARRYARYDDDEKEEKVIKLVWDTVVPRLGYEREYARRLNWGIARKPAHPKADTRTLGDSGFGLFRRGNSGASKQP